MTIKFSDFETSKEPTYDLHDIRRLKSRNATSIKLVQLQIIIRGEPIFGIIGIKDGEKMNEPNDLIVLPCPPFCPDGNLETFSYILANFDAL